MRPATGSSRLAGLACLALAALAAAALPVAAEKPKLSDVVKQAAKPPAEQEPVGAAAPSESKTKSPDSPPAPDWPSAPPPPADRPAGHGEVIVFPEVHGAAALLPVELVGYSFGGVLPGDAPRADSPSVLLRAGITGGGGGLETRSIEGYGGAGLLAGIAGGPWSLDVRGLRSAARLSADLSPALREFRAWSGDLALRYRLTAPTSRLGMNLVLTGRLGRFGWKYANAVTVVESWGERVVRRDTLPYRAVLGGLGVEAAHSGDWSLWLTASAGVQQFADDTGAGFANDLFGDRAVFEVTADLVRTLHAPPDESDYRRPRRR